MWRCLWFMRRRKLFRRICQGGCGGCLSCVVGCAAGGGGSGVQYNVMGGLWLVASCAGLLVVRRSLVRFPNCHECPVASGLGNLTSRRPDSGAFVGCLPYWVAFGGLSHIVGYILWWVVSYGGLHLVLGCLWCGGGLSGGVTAAQ